MSNFIKQYKVLPQLKKNYISGSLCSGANIVIMLFAYPIYLNYLGAEKYGIWVTLSIVLSLSQLGQLRIDTALIKFIAEEYGKKNLKCITEYATTASIILIFPGLLIILVVTVFYPYIDKFINYKRIFLTDGKYIIICVGILSSLTLYYNLIKGIVIGIGRLDIANYISFFSRVVQIAVSISLLIVGFEIWSLFFGFLFYTILASTVLFLFLSLKYKIDIFNYKCFKVHKLSKLINFGSTLLIGTVAQMLVEPFNKAIIAKFVGFSEVTFLPNFIPSYNDSEKYFCKRA